MHIRPLGLSITRMLGAAAMLAALVGFGREASAEYFQFSATTTIGAVAPAPSGIVGNNSDLVTITTAGGTPIVFTGLETVPPENLVGIDGGTDIVFALIDVQVVNATPFQNISIPFTFDVTITDYPTDIVGVPNGSGTFTITGSISGSLGAGRKVLMNNIVLNPVAPIVIGGNPYEMALNTIVPPGPFFPGAIGARVSIIPEPTTFVLFGLGIACVATPAVRRWRKNARAARN